MVVSKVDYTNNHKLGRESPPAVVRCYINHNDKGALYAAVGGKKLKRLGVFPKPKAGLLPISCPT